ncbi:MAG: carbamoylsarcosine amidase [Planctomycetaceae bacterium]|nr:carbamoylsarcosine amidase [Planctomycetaceae bacterium]
MNQLSDELRKHFEEAIATADEYYKSRGIFQDRFGFGGSPAIVVVDFAYGWTDDSYAGGSARLDVPVQNTATLIEFARTKNVPIVYTTSPYRAASLDQPFKSAADDSAKYRDWDAHACEIDDRVAPLPHELVIEKENASAFFGTHLAAFLISNKVDTLLITGCSTSACIRATATDAKSYRFRPVIISDGVGDRSEAAHLFTLADIQARFSDVCSMDTALEYLAAL